MKAHKALLLLATGLCTANRSLAQTANCSPDKERTAVYFVNGMFTDEWDAENNLSSLRWLAGVALQNTVGADGSIIFQNAYNQNEPAWEQLVQVYAQKAGDDLSMFWRMMAGNASLPDWLRQAISDASTSSAAQPFTNDADLQEHLQRYRQVLDLHEKLIIVGHSQGNLYANAAYAALAAEKAEYAAATGVIGVATPASTVAGAVDGALYTTFNEDWVIQTVRFLYPNTLPPNATTGTTSVDTLGHGFQTAYLVVPDSRNQILSNVLTVEARLAPVPKPATGLDPTCLPLITDPADCADALAGSCVDKFFGTCWDPSGSCSILTSTASASANLIAVGAPVWSNGARINMAANMANPDSPTVVVSVVGSTGNVCATGVSQVTDGACFAEAIYQARGESLLDQKTWSGRTLTG